MFNIYLLKNRFFKYIVVIFMKLEIQILFIYLTEFPELLIEQIFVPETLWI